MVCALIDKGTLVQGYDRESLHGCATQGHGSSRQAGSSHKKNLTPTQRTLCGLPLLNHGTMRESLYLPEPHSPCVSHNGSK